MSIVVQTKTAPALVWLRGLLAPRCFQIALANLMGAKFTGRNRRDEEARSRDGVRSCEATGDASFSRPAD